MIHSPSSGSNRPQVHYHDPSLIPPFTHLYGTRLPEISIWKTFDTGSNCIRPSRKPTTLILLVEKIRGGNRGDLKQWELSHTTYKGMTPPSTQNLKALGLCVFFLICCSIFSFLPNLGLRLTLEYLKISPSSESFSSTLIHFPSSESNWPRVHYSWPLTCTAVHTLIRDMLAWNLHQEDFRYRVKLYSSKP